MRRFFFGTSQLLSGMFRFRGRDVGLVFLLMGAVAFTLASVRIYQLELPVRDFPAFLASVRAYWRGGDLYTPHSNINLNPPHASILLFTPLMLVDAARAQVLWFTAIAFGVAFAIVLIQRTLKLSSDRLWWVVAVLGASSAMQHTWRQGQLGAVLLVLSTLAWRAERRGASGSLWLAAAISIKPWIACWLPLQARRRALATIAIGLCGLATGVVLIGPASWLAWFGALEAHDVWPAPANLGLFGALVRYGGQVGEGADVSWSLATPFWVVGSLALVATSWRQRHGDLDRAWLLWGLTAILVSPIGWSYYLLVLTGPLIAWGERNRWPIPALVALGILVLPSEGAYMLWAMSPLTGSVYSAGALILWATVVRHGCVTESVADVAAPRSRAIAAT